MSVDQLIIIFILRGPGGLHQNSLEINFIVVSDRLALQNSANFEPFQNVQ